jgi:hypothetical protein
MEGKDVETAATEEGANPISKTSDKTFYTELVRQEMLQTSVQYIARYRRIFYK